MPEKEGYFMPSTIAIIKDTRVDIIGSAKFAIDIWKIVILPVLLNNGELWDITNKDVQRELEGIQSSYFKGILAVPNSVPKPSICYEANLLQMKYHLFARFLNFLKHIHCQDKTVLAKQVLEEQLEHSWPGPSLIAEKVMAELNISGVFDGEVEKKEFKRRISKACEEKNDETLIESISSYKKMGALRNEVKKGNEYFFRESLTNVRTLFRFKNDLFEAK